MNHVIPKDPAVGVGVEVGVGVGLLIQQTLSLSYLRGERGMLGHENVSSFISENKRGIKQLLNRSKHSSSGLGIKCQLRHGTMIFTSL